MEFQQQHSSQVQFGHSFAVLLILHSKGKQPQSAHLICMILGGKTDISSFFHFI